MRAYFLKTKTAIDNNDDSLALSLTVFNQVTFLVSAASMIVWSQRPMKENPKKRPSDPPSSAT